MKLLTRLERFLARFALPHLTLYIVFFQSLAYVLIRVEDARSPEHAGQMLSRLLLNGELVLHGELWRLISFVAAPPITNPIFFFFAMYLLFMMGTALENHWGTFRYNVFLLVGWLATAGAALALPTGPATNMYLMESIFLAFAFLYPEFELLLFFVLPVKVKWLALLTWIVYFVQFATGGWLDKLLIIAAIANFLLFFHKHLWRRARAGHRRFRLHAETAKTFGQPFNRCTACGVTEKSNPKMEFRYCPQCAGTPCYCIEHIHAHEHRGGTERPAPTTGA